MLLLLWHEKKREGSILLKLTNNLARYSDWPTHYLISVCLWALLVTFLLVNIWNFQGTLRSPLHAPKMTLQHPANPSKTVCHLCNRILFIWTFFLETKFYLNMALLIYLCREIQMTKFQSIFLRSIIKPWSKLTPGCKHALSLYLK